MKGIMRVLVWTVLLLVLSFFYAQSNYVSAREFKDVPKNHPNYATIQEMEAAGFLNGYPDGKFRPSEPISRKHVAVLLDQVLGLQKLDTKKAVFTDVPMKHPYYTPIMKLYQEGIISKGVNGKFNPEASVTRVQMAKLLDLAFDLKIRGTRWFDDLDSTHWGVTHVDALYSNGITSGDNGDFHPNRPVTRAHYAEFLSRSIRVGKSKPSTDKVTDEEALDLFFRMPVEIENHIIQSKIEKKKFSQARASLFSYATERFTDGLLKQEYPHLCKMCDAFLFPYVSFEVGVRFEYEQPDPNTLKVQTILVHTPGAVLGGGFVDYIYKKENNRWKMHEHKFTKPGKKNFELTMEEAKLILEEFYGDEGEVRYLKKSSKLGKDPVTSEKYSYEQYSFSTFSDTGYDVVVVNSDDGWFE